MNNHYEPDSDAPDTSKLTEQHLRQRIAELEVKLSNALDALKPFAYAAMDSDVERCLMDDELCVYAPDECTFMFASENQDRLTVSDLHKAFSVYGSLTGKSTESQPHQLSMMTCQVCGTPAMHLHSDGEKRYCETCWKKRG